MSIKPQLTTIAALATRWRKLELASWRNTIAAAAAAHAAGANRLWFHLYQLLLAQPAMRAPPPPNPNHDAAGARGPGAAGAAAEEEEEERWYRGAVSTLEAVMQTSTVGEYRARLQLLGSFLAHLRVRLAQHDGGAAAAAADVPGGGAGGTEVEEGAVAPERLAARQRLLAAALGNVLAYYSQFSPAVDEAIKVRSLLPFCLVFPWRPLPFL